MTPFEPKTLYQAQTGVGYAISFASMRTFVELLSNGGILWVRPRYQDQTVPVPTTPIPGNGTLVDGWIRLANGDGISWGKEYGGGIKAIGAPAIIGIQVWCESTSDLIVNAR